MFNNLGKRCKGALNSLLLSCLKRNCLLYNVLLWSGFSFTHCVCFVTVLSAFEALQRDVPACTGTCYTNYTLTYLSPRPRVCRSVGVFPESITNTIKVSFFLFIFFRPDSWHSFEPNPCDENLISDIDRRDAVQLFEVIPLLPVLQHLIWFHNSRRAS